MDATGIVAEYNPFHKGHLYHLQQTKEKTGQPVIVVMSGSFMQRGEPAFLSKWLRAKLAVENGAALVIELPAAFSLRSAQYFADGAVQLLNATGLVRHLSCGVESANTDFAHIARSISSSEAQQRLQQLLKAGTSYASACAQLVSGASCTAPNDILALEYCKALLNTPIIPIFIARQGAGYNDTALSETQLASATAIRIAYQSADECLQDAVPPNVADALSITAAGYDRILLWHLLSYRLRLLTAPEIAQCCQCSEGLENLLKAAADCQSLEEALAFCTHKRYTTSRIRRLLCQLLLNVSRSTIEQSRPAYIRVLAFDDIGRALLKAMKETATLPIITKLGRSPEQRQSQAFAEQIMLETKASDLWSLLQNDKRYKKVGSDFLHSPAYVR